MAEYRIEIDQDLCVGDGLCREIAPDTFDLDEDSRCVLKNADGDPSEDVLHAARECLTKAIVLYDVRTGDRVYPRD
jgi:ferredoxin